MKLIIAILLILMMVTPPVLSTCNYNKQGHQNKHKQGREKRKTQNNPPFKKSPCRDRGEKSQTNEAPNQTDAEADESDDHEHQQKRLTSDTGAKRSHPANSLSDKSCHIGQQSCHSHGSTPLQPDKPTNQANAEADESDDHESENQRIRGNGTNKGANPLDSLSDERSHIGQNSSDSNGSFSMKSFHLSN